MGRSPPSPLTTLEVKSNFGVVVSICSLVGSSLYYANQTQMSLQGRWNMPDYMQYWKNEPTEDELLDHTASDQLANRLLNDVIWVVTFRSANSSSSALSLLVGWLDSRRLKRFLNIRLGKLIIMYWPKRERRSIPSLLISVKSPNYCVLKVRRTGSQKVFQGLPSKKSENSQQNPQSSLEKSGVNFLVSFLQGSNCCGRRTARKSHKERPFHFCHGERGSDQGKKRPRKIQRKSSSPP